MSKSIRRFLFWGVVFIVIVSWYSITTKASQLEEKELERVEESIFDSLELEEMESLLGEVFPEEELSFRDLVKQVMDGDLEETGEFVLAFIWDKLMYELEYNRNTFVHIMLLIFLSAIFTNLSKAMGNQQIESVGFLVIYFLIVVLCMRSFDVLVTDIAGKLEILLQFMGVLSPIYFLSVALSTGVNSALVFYNLTILYIYFVELLIANIVIPLINAYIVIVILNYISQEQRLNKLGELVKLVIYWLLKTMIGAVVGLNVIQGMISPVIDSLQRNIWLKSAEAVPVVGDAVGGGAEVIFSSITLIKNSIGVVGLLICLSIVIGPVVQLTLIVLLYKFAAALVEPISDKRIVGCVNCIGEGSRMLLKTVMSIGILFLVTIAIVATSTT